MERFGRPRMRGSGAPKPYGARLGPSNRSTGLLGAAPRQPSDQYGSYNKPKDWPPRSSNSDGSLLGKPRNVQMRSNSYDSNSRASDGRPSSQSSFNVPSEVQQLMKSLGLSQEDMQRLSQLPEKELSVNNLAKAIGDLKRGKNQFEDRSNSNSYNTPLQRSVESSRRSDPFPSSSRNSFSRDKGRNFGGNSVLGDPPSQQGSFHNRSNQYKNDRSESGDRSFGTPPGRHKHSNMKVTVKPGDPLPGNRSRMVESKHNSDFSDRPSFSSKVQRDEFFDEQEFYDRRNADHFDQPKHDSFSQNSRRVNDQNFNVREVERRSQGFGNERRVERVRESPQGRAARGNMHRPVGTRNVSKPASSLPSLLDLPLSPKGRRSGGSLLGGHPRDHPRDHGSPGLDKLVAAVGNNSLLTPLMLASQTNPSVLEVQIQAMKALQAQAMKLRTDGRDRDRPPRRLSPPPPRGFMVDRRLNEEARREVQTLRQARGRVLYMKYKSPRIIEKDLRQLASPFGRVTKLLIIKPKIKNGHFQAFMEMQQWDSAAAMLERFISKPPSIKGCLVDVMRSNYVDLQLKSDLVNPGAKRKRPISPIRKGSTQLPVKRNRRQDSKPKLSITTSRSERRVVSQSDEKQDLKSDKKTDAREILNRSRIAKKKLDGDKDVSDDMLNDSDTLDKSEDDVRMDSDKMLGNDAKTGTEKDIDPLDVIADELALHDEFVLMDEVGYDRKRTSEEDKKNLASDLDESELDLDNLKVEFGQDDQDLLARAEKDHLIFNTEEELIASILDEIIKKVEDRFFNEEEKAEAEKALLMMNYSDDESSFEGFSVDDNEVHNYVYDDEPSVEEQAPVAEPASAEEQPPNVDSFTSEDQATTDDQEPPVDQKPEEIQEPEKKQEPEIEQEPCEEESKKEVSKTEEDQFQDDSLDYDEEGMDEEEQDTDEQPQGESEAQRLRSMMADSLTEIQEAKNHLNALVRVTKAKAAQTLAKKLRVCLEAAISQLESADPSLE